MYPFDGVLQMKQDCITRIFGNVATMQHEMMYPCHDKFCQWGKCCRTSVKREDNSNFKRKMCPFYGVLQMKSKSCRT